MILTAAFVHSSVKHYLSFFCEYATPTGAPTRYRWSSVNTLLLRVLLLATGGRLGQVAIRMIYVRGI